MSTFGQQDDLKHFKQFNGHQMVFKMIVLVLFNVLIGNLFLVQCEKKFLIYSAEEGKKILSIERNENLICRWIKLEESETLILAFIDIKTFLIKWIVNCEFELKGGEMVLESNEPIFDVQVDPQSKNLFILQSSSLTRLKFPFNSTEEHENNSVILISKLSKNLRTVFRVIDDVKGQLLKLLKLDDSVFIRLSESDCSLIRNLLLFGYESTTTTVASTIASSNLHLHLSLNISESEVLDWKSKLKKQHAELLVSVQEVSSVIRSFLKNYPKFCHAEIDRFLEIDLIQLEEKSRLLQHDLAEFLVWLENLIIPDVNSGGHGIKPFKPESRAFELIKSIQRSEDSIIERHELWSSTLNDFKLILDLEFKDLVNKINSFKLQRIDRNENIPISFNQIISTNPLVLLNEEGTEILKYDKVVKLSNEYIAHYYNNNQLQLICKGYVYSIGNGLADNKDDSDSISIFNDQSNTIFVNPLSNQLYLVPSIDPSKLKIK
jgi:hypothetical protein